MTLHAPVVSVVDVIAPFVAAGVFIGVMSFVREPERQRFNAVFVAGAGAAYFSSGFGTYEIVFAGVITALAFLGLRSYAFIGVAWLLHSVWDALHHVYGDPIIVFAPTSSFGCAICDAVIAVWFIAISRAKGSCTRDSPREKVHA